MGMYQLIMKTSPSTNERASGSRTPSSGRADQPVEAAQCRARHELIGGVAPRWLEVLEVAEELEQVHARRFLASDIQFFETMDRMLLHFEGSLALCVNAVQPIRCSIWKIVEANASHTSPFLAKLIGAPRSKLLILTLPISRRDLGTAAPCRPRAMEMPIAIACTATDEARAERVVSPNLA